jgi:hypothetical protein
MRQILCHYLFKGTTTTPAQQCLLKQGESIAIPEKGQIFTRFENRLAAGRASFADRAISRQRIFF